MFKNQNFRVHFWNPKFEFPVSVYFVKRSQISNCRCDVIAMVYFSGKNPTKDTKGHKVVQ